MIVVRFKVQSQPEKTEQVVAAFEEVIAPAAQSMPSSASTSPETSSTPTRSSPPRFEDRAALDRQESLPEVKNTLAALEQSLTAEPDATVFRVFLV
jgi:quinol monooxygenase YgiN